MGKEKDMDKELSDMLRGAGGVRKRAAGKGPPEEAQAA